MSYPFDKEPVAPNSLFNLDLEKQFLSSVIRNPSVLADCPQVTEKSFSVTNRCVFAAIRAMQASNQEINEYTLVARLDGLNVKIGGELEPKNYIPALTMMGVAEHAAESIGKELVALEINREMWLVGQRISVLASEKVKKYKQDGGFMRAGEIVNEATKIFNEKVNVLGGEEKQPIDLYGTIGAFLERDNSISDKAIALPYKIFTDLFGFLDAGTAPTTICSRMKIGKSSLWLSSMREIAENDADDNFRVLVLDTELSEWENQSRSLAAISGVKEFYIRQGWYKKNREMRKKVEEAAAYLAPLTRRVEHFYCGGMDLNEIMSVCRRWGRKNLDDNKRGLIVYDYIKLNSMSDFSKSSSLFVAFGEKIDALKNIGKELNVATLCFCQTNRENVDSKQGEKQQSTAVIGGSDMIAQFSSNVFLLEKLTEDERNDLGQLTSDGATHSLKILAERQQGPRELGEDKPVKITVQNGPNKGKIKIASNYILFRFDNFNVKEVGTFRSAMERAAVLGAPIQDDVKTDNQNIEI